MPRASRATIEGLKEASDKLIRFLKTLETAPTQIMLQEAPRIQAVAKVRTPIKSGKLRQSVTVRVSRDKRRPGMYAQASASHKGYGYAYVQHENEEFKHPRGGQAFYLQTAFEEGVNRIIQRLESEVRYE